MYFLVSGSFWIDIFFILSGFALTISYFKTKKTDLIVGGLFKRFIRLLIPTIAIFSFYHICYLLSKENSYFFSHDNRDLSLFFKDLFIGTWNGDKHYTYATWTIPLELYCSYFALIFAQVAINLKHRWLIYIFVFSFI